MTGNCSGPGAIGALAALKRLREHWIAIAAAVSALFWARDLLADYAALPGELARQDRAIVAIEARLGDLESGRGHAPAAPGRPAAGTLEGPALGHAGRWSGFVWRSAATADPACAPEGISAVLVDPSGRWHVLPARLDGDAGEPAGDALAIGVRPHDRMGRGHARIALRIRHRCDGVPLDDVSPWLPFALSGG